MLNSISYNTSKQIRNIIVISSLIIKQSILWSLLDILFYKEMKLQIFENSHKYSSV